MPTTLPGISVGEAQRLVRVTDRIIREFPEVERVFGKAGRAEDFLPTRRRFRCWRR